MSPIYNVPSYPKELILTDRSRVTVRPMVREDEDALLEFFRKVPEGDRFYLRDDVASSEVIRDWAQDLDYDRVLPLLALRDDKVIADGTLHRHKFGARKGIGEIRVVVDPEFRNIGLGRAVMRELIDLAEDVGLEKVLFELVPAREEPAVRTSIALGFQPLADLPGLVPDLSGQIQQDLVIMQLDMSTWEAWTEEDF